MSGTSLKLRRFCAFVIGVVFFVSGSFKLMDPIGTGLIVSEYYSFFHLGFLKLSAYFVGLTLSLVETFAGVMLMTGVLRRLSAITASVLIVVFTCITFILLIFNPSFDCGCFGRVLSLSHLQSFVKNIALLAFAVAAFIPFKGFGRPKRVKYVTSALILAAVLGITIHSVLFIPLIDFTDFRGSTLLAAAVEEDGGEDYVATFVYEKNGREGVFTLDKLPDSTWTFVRSDVLKKTETGNKYFPHLSFTDALGNYRDSIAARGTVMVQSIYKASSFTEAKWKKAYEYMSSAARAGFTPLLLVAGDVPEGVIPRMLPVADTLGTESSTREYIYRCDYKTLLSLNRSNGGATYFNKGNLIEKWAWRALPSDSELAKLQRKNATETMMAASTKGRLVFQAFMLYSFILVLLF